MKRDLPLTSVLVLRAYVCVVSKSSDYLYLLTTKEGAMYKSNNGSIRVEIIIPVNFCIIVLFSILKLKHINLDVSCKI